MKTHLPFNVNVPHPDMNLVRKGRIEKLEYLKNKAAEEKNYGLEKKFQKELEIQLCYVQIGQ